MSKIMTASILLILTALLILWSREGKSQAAPAIYSCSLDGKVVYQGESDSAAWSRCRSFVLGNPKTLGVFARTAPVSGKPVTQMLTLSNSSEYGTWTWVPPTKLENGNILTDLSHFLIYRQPLGQPAGVWAQVDKSIPRLITRMGPADFNACFWMTAVRKPGTSPAVESDKSNTICMDSRGQLLPAT